ncbi:hypothetical protein M3Y99_01751100 [Aphelenchoides fujianensis]|nr:hypothetical protein M3Y99_01751100 [Aphelenchoides fujianensis]
MNRSQSTSRLGSSGRVKTPARPLYAARLPPIHHPLGAPASPRPDQPSPDPVSEPVISTGTVLTSIPKIRPTTARPLGTQLSAKTSMAGSAGNGLKPLPAIGEPYRSSSSRAKRVKPSPVRMALKCLIICMFLSIPVLIFLVMMVLSGGFEPVNDGGMVVGNATDFPPMEMATMGPAGQGNTMPTFLRTTIPAAASPTPPNSSPLPVG